MTQPPPPELTADTAPREAVTLALAWLATVVPDVKAVCSKGVLRRSRGPLRVQIGFQSSTYSRRGLGTWVSLYVNVGDGAFGRWRAQHPELTWRTGELVHATGALSPSLQLYGDEPGYRTLAEIPRLLETEWLPTLDLFDSPERLAREYDASKFGVFTCMEWMVSRGDIGSARHLLERYLDAHPLSRETIDTGRAAGLPPEGTPIRDVLVERWAPTLETLGIVAPGEPLPGVAPAVLPERVDAAAEIRGILSAFGRVLET